MVIPHIVSEWNVSLWLNISLCFPTEPRINLKNGNNWFFRIKSKFWLDQELALMSHSKQNILGEKSDASQREFFMKNYKNPICEI